MLALAIILISLALAFYTLGVWAERRTGELRWWHVAAFAAGLTADVSGTVVMTMIANGGGATGVEQSPVLAQLMAATGLVALLLMVLHLGWITVENGEIVSSEAIQYPNGNHEDQEINAYAIPQLDAEVVEAQSAGIDAVSGATVTSDGYIESLQSAIDEANLKRALR